MLIDLLTVLFLLIFVLWGSAKGAAKMVMRLLGLGASVFMGFVFYKPISSVLTRLGIEDGISAKLAENIDQIVHLPGVMRDVMTATGAVDGLTHTLAESAVSVVSFLAVVVIIRALLFVVSLVVGVAGSLPVIKQTNGLMGGILGFLLGVLALFLIFGVMAVAEVLGSANFVGRIFDGSLLASLLYDNNPLLGLVIK